MGGAWGGNGFPVGVRTARQGVDPDTGGITYYAMFPAGSHFDLHWHSHDEHVVVVSGELSIQLGEQTHSLSVGSYVVIPGECLTPGLSPRVKDAVIWCAVPVRRLSLRRIIPFDGHPAVVVITICCKQSKVYGERMA